VFVLKINKTELMQALQKVNSGLSNKELIEHTNCYYFTGNEIITFNDEIYIKYPFETDFSGMVNADKFFSLISKISPDTKGLINIDIVNGELIVKSGRTKSGFSFNTEETLPLDEINDSIKNISKWKKVPDNFTEGIRLASFCVSKNISAPLLSCLNIKNKSILSTDRYRAFEFKLKQTMDSFLLNSNCVSFLSKLELSKYSTQETWSHFKTTNGLGISIRTYENDDYPDVNSFFKHSGNIFEFPNDMDKVIDKSIVFCEGVNETDRVINIKIDKSKLIISSQSEIGWFKEIVKCNAFANTVEFSLNPFFLKDILSKTNECEICIDDDGGLIKFVSDSWKHIIALKMN